MAVQLCDLQTNYLQTNGFQLILPRFPLVTFYAQTFNMPGISFGTAVAETPFVQLPFAGDKPFFDPFSFTFIVDDRMDNYREIHSWMMGVGYPKSYESYTTYENKGKKEQILGEQDAKVAILSAKSNPTAHITFYDAFPIGLSGTTFTTQDTGTTYVMAEATFAYTYFAFDKE